MNNVKRRIHLFTGALSCNNLIFSFILAGVIAIYGCADNRLRILDLTDNSMEKGFVDFCPHFANKAKYPSKTKLFVYKYDKEDAKSFSMPVGSGIRLIERPGVHTYFVKITGSTESEKVIVDAVDKMITPVMIDVDWGPIKHTGEMDIDMLDETIIERFKQYFYMKVSVNENIPINLLHQVSACTDY